MPQAVIIKAIVCINAGCNGLQGFRQFTKAGSGCQYVFILFYMSKKILHSLHS